MYFYMLNSQTNRDSLVAAFQSNMVDETVEINQLSELHFKKETTCKICIFSNCIRIQDYVNYLHV